MAEFSRTTYDFNSRFTLNDDTTDVDKFALVEVESIADIIAQNIEEERPEEPGIIDYGIKLSKGIFEIPLTLYASSEANMRQLVENLKEAFHPDLLEADATYGEDTRYNGYHPLKWTETIGATEYDVQVYVKSMEVPKVQMDSLSGLIRKSVLRLKLEDPRKYTQAQSTVTTDGGTATNAGTVDSPVEITFTATGTTLTSLFVSNGKTGEAVYIPTALTSGQVLFIDTRRRSVTLNGTENKKYISAGSTWWHLKPGANVIVFENNSNVSISVAYRSAWPI